MTFKVRLTRDAKADLDRLFDFLLERELSREVGDPGLPKRAIAALRSGIATLKTLSHCSRSRTRRTSPF